MIIECLICKSAQSIKFIDDYKFEVNKDKDFFGEPKIYGCKNCNFYFVHPMPKESNIDNFYHNIYRAKGRPHFWGDKNDKSIERNYLDDKNLNYLLYLTTFINFNKINTIFDFGAGIGDLGFLIRKKFKHIKLYCCENDKYSENILEKRKYKNFKNFNDINLKFDLVISLHSIEHLPNLELLPKLKDLLNPSGCLFFEVPNCPFEKNYINRPFDCPHLLFFTENSWKKISNNLSMNWINLSLSSYSMEDDFMYQKDSKKRFGTWTNDKSDLKNQDFRALLKKIVPNFLIDVRRKYIDLKKFKNENRYKWFVNNSNDNAFIRGILKKGD